MTDKELKKLKRLDLIRILVERTKEVEALKARVTELEKQLEAKDIAVSQAGSIAEAALKLNKVFEAAQQAADQYLENIRDKFGGDDGG